MTVERAKTGAVQPPTKKVSAARRQFGSVVPVGAKNHDEVDVTQFVRDISEMIDAARKHVAVNANITIVTLHRHQVLDECRASEAWRCA
ncbi:MAG: hypothetical protein QM766_27155 [Burkholderiaceae bacterium]